MSSESNQQSQCKEPDHARQTKSLDHRPRSLDDRFSLDQLISSPRSLDGAVVLGTYPREVVQKAYADLYASSFGSSDSDSESDENRQQPTQSFGSPPVMDAKVLRFQSAAPRMPAVRVGAARLSEMMMYNRRMQPSGKESDKAGTRVPGSHLPENPLVSDTGEQSCAQELHYDQDLSSVAAAAPLGELAPQTSISRQPSLGSQMQQETQSQTRPLSPQRDSNDKNAGIDDFNGLVAPGAMADEKQKAKADGKTPFHALLQLLRNNDAHAQEEARLFKPTVLSTSKARAADPFALDAFDETTRRTSRAMSKFPFCCCPARYCVAISFVAVLVSALLGFFLWPRVPTISINSLTPLSAAHLVYDTRQNVFGLRMPVQVSYEIHSGNFYPLLISNIHVSGFDGVTGNRILDTTLRNIRVKQSRLQFYRANAELHYLTSDMSDPALVDLYGKCAPRSSLRQIHFAQAQTTGRPGALTIRFQIKLDVHNLGWIRQPIVTLNQNINCPE
ncbi:hypothetical protein LPJ64_000003 [Coemansia asiatica]|uniref:Uncharacterized protein n=1 Tax=Coemansia asiatica TaxID=1052880 RepID=A0A9W7XR24_9FUNG|nr:hypothetical protein LPJ64_000003 [Coemansia asiatica]